jgi:hypothetical protein
MARAGRKPIDPKLRKVKVNLQYTSVHTWAYDELIHEARRVDGSLSEQVANAITLHARRLKRGREKREQSRSRTT